MKNIVKLLLIPLLSLTMINYANAVTFQNRESLARALRDLGSSGIPTSKNVEYKGNDIYEVRACFKENFAKFKESQNSHEEPFENSVEKARNRNYSNFSKEKNDENVLGYRVDLIFGQEGIEEIIKNAKKSYKGLLKIEEISRKAYSKEGEFCVTKKKRAWLE